MIREGTDSTRSFAKLLNLLQRILVLEQNRRGGPAASAEREECSRTANAPTPTGLMGRGNMAKENGEAFSQRVRTGCVKGVLT